jgi:para-aminobenzoate synthetase/4-amino-4-deoxychorismate lyase
VKNGFCEVIFCNIRDEITEGAISNIIIRQAGFFYTPPQASGLLAGIGRAYLLEKHHGSLLEKTLYPDDLKNAEAIYVVNSVRGVTEVRL